MAMSKAPRSQRIFQSDISPVSIAAGAYAKQRAINFGGNGLIAIARSHKASKDACLSTGYGAVAIQGRRSGSSPPDSPGPKARGSMTTAVRPTHIML